MSWHERGACNARPDLTWFPVAGNGGRGGQPAEYVRAIAAAIAVCRTCPVIDECREAGRGEHGIWGGEHHTASSVQAPPIRQVDPCGTTGAYARHRRMGEEPCGPCRAAIARYQRDRADAASAAAATRVRLMLGRAG